MKKIYWIDDDVRKITNYIQGIFKELWGEESEEGISSIIRVFGDAYKIEDMEKDWGDKEKKQLQEKMRNYLLDHCRNLDKWNWDGGTFKEKKKLIEIEPQIISIHDAEVERIIKEWEAIDSIDSIIEKELEEKEKRIEELIEKMKIPDGVGVAIDVILLKDDRKRIDENKAIISMALYNVLKKKGNECVLYSSFLYDFPLEKKWKEIYKKVYKDEVDKIYDGREMKEAEKYREIKTALKKIAKEGVENVQAESNTGNE